MVVQTAICVTFLSAGVIWLPGGGDQRRYNEKAADPGADPRPEGF
jgi:hypothetical protein